MRVSYVAMSSPVGPIGVAWTDDTILAIQMEEAKDRRSWNEKYLARKPVERMMADLSSRFGEISWKPGAHNAPAVKALKKYFAGEPDAIDALEVDAGGTPFQARVWRALRRIPPGRTLTYGELAKRVRSPAGARAAGGAVGANPIPIIIPCHRVVGSEGRLTGFGGGLARKKWLLEHEGAVFRED